jgi:hypothetical protein
MFREKYDDTLWRRCLYSTYHSNKSNTDHNN